MKEVFKKYINDEIKFDRDRVISIISLIIVISGVVGWLYEFIFYYFNGGMRTFYMQGGNFLPWINIYAIGAVMIVLFTYKLKKKPLLVFLISFISTGILEYFSGYFIYKIGDGTRYWDYNTEILNFGNIDGFVCLRSVLIFGLSSLVLMYILIPICIYISNKINKKTLKKICLILLIIILTDEIYNLVFTRLFNLPSAIHIYKAIGFKYVK